MVAALSWAARLKNGLARTREVLNTPVSELFVRRRVDESLFEDLQSALLQADCGVAATDWLLESLREKARRERIEDAEVLKRALSADVVIADTAGRLPTQLHLMEEIRKVKRVAAKAQGDAPHEVLLVLDANTGQNAIAQVKAFDDALGLTGLVLTKLDGTAKGGVVCAIARERPVPLLFAGVGEDIDDLRPFKAQAFAEALVG